MNNNFSRRFDLPSPDMSISGSSEISNMSEEEESANNYFQGNELGEKDVGLAFSEQSKQELTILYNDNIHLGGPQECGVSLDIKEIDMNAIRSLIENEPYNEALFKLLFCTVQLGLIYPSVKSEDGFTGYASVINSLITELISVSRENHHETYSMKIGRVANVFSLKTSFSMDKEKDDIVHEFFVGYHLNKLRTTENVTPQSPNFLYVYGLFKCFASGESSPIPLLCPENGTDRKYFMLTENLRAPQLTRRLHDISFTNIISLYSQIVLSLHTALVTNKFTHYDLHAANIIVEDLRAFSNNKSYSKSQLIPYFIGGEMVFVRATFLAKIINYGKAHVVSRFIDVNSYYPEQRVHHFGNISGILSNITGLKPLDSNPIFDLFRITGSIAFQLLESKNYDVYHQFLPLLLRFPSVRRMARRFNLIYNRSGGRIVNREFEQFIRDNEQKKWPYTTENSSMENNDIYLVTKQFIEQLSSEKIMYNFSEAYESILKKDPASGLTESWIYECNGNCHNIDQLMKPALKPIETSVKRRK